MTQGNPQQPQSAVSAFPPDLQAASASKEDRTLAMIGHLLGLTSFVGPLILLLLKKDGANKFILFHIKQVLFWEIAVIVAVIALAILASLIGLVTGGLGCVCMPLPFLLFLGSGIYNVIGAIQVNGGKDFEYIVVGPWVRKSI
jgi:uncharacterized Tic20 family protein